MPKVVGVQFKNNGKVYVFDSLDFNIDVKDAVLVETSKGVEIGFCKKSSKLVDDDEINYELKPIIRKATEEDLDRYRKNIIDSNKALQVCKELVIKHNLDMNLLEASYTFLRDKLLFIFTSEDRVDFRELVKDLARNYKTRIELRQIGVRDEAKLVGGIGPCGRELCCKKFLHDFGSVSVTMAKNQNISLNPTKISGMCGRLMCCLQYEDDWYKEKKSELPTVGSRVRTPRGVGEIIEVYPMKDNVKIKIEKEDLPEIAIFNISEIEKFECCHNRTIKEDEIIDIFTFDYEENLDEEELLKLIKEDELDDVDKLEEIENVEISVENKENSKKIHKENHKENHRENHREKHSRHKKKYVPKVNLKEDNSHKNEERDQVENNPNREKKSFKSRPKKHYVKKDASEEKMHRELDEKRQDAKNRIKEKFRKKGSEENTKNTREKKYYKRKDEN